ncbi:DUF11 domain-containing protein [Durusdinium trenchii]|uniref:DUF11 domain-containing protein n=1 Tax=Durusdinium trenchii TaxID=1381693 RepID=A0ABP0LD72_9DINO
MRTHSLRLFLIREVAIRAVPRGLAAAALLTATSCSTVDQVTRRPAHNDGGVQHAYTATETSSRSEIQPLSLQQAQQRPPASHSTTQPSLPPVAQAIPTEMPGQGGFQSIQPVAAVKASGAGFAEEACPPIIHDCEPRVAITPPGTLPYPQGANCPTCPPPYAPPMPPEYVGDEYICDGGDRGLPIHYDTLGMQGLETEDTVAEFVDHNGESGLRISNKTCIYAPRFAAVRAATQPVTDYGVDRALGHFEERRIAGLETKVVLDQKIHTDELQGVLMRARASGIESGQTDHEVKLPQKANVHAKLRNAFEDFAFVRDGQLDDVSLAVIGEAIEAAGEWTRSLSPIIAAKDLAGQEVTARFIAEDYTAYEDRRTPGDLRIVKLADRSTAKPGDIVTFTIRFDNVGGRELHDVRIVDNLTPRLEFIDGSVDSNLAGEVEPRDNGEGSVILSFFFGEPLPGGEGGWVSFQCRVR